MTDPQKLLRNGNLIRIKSSVFDFNPENKLSGKETQKPIEWGRGCLKKMGIFSLVRKTPLVYQICAPDMSQVQQRTELGAINRTFRKLISIGYEAG